MLANVSILSLNNPSIFQCFSLYYRAMNQAKKGAHKSKKGCTRKVTRSQKRSQKSHKVTPKKLQTISLN